MLCLINCTLQMCLAFSFMIIHACIWVCVLPAAILHNIGSIVKSINNRQPVRCSTCYMTKATLQLPVSTSSNIWYLCWLLALIQAAVFLSFNVMLTIFHSIWIFMVVVKLLVIFSLNVILVPYLQLCYEMKCNVSCSKSGCRLFYGTSGCMTFHASDTSCRLIYHLWIKTCICCVTAQHTNPQMTMPSS